MMSRAPRRGFAAADAPPGSRLTRALRPAEWVFAAVLLASGAGAFVGLGASSWWTDELFTLFMIDHGGGGGEVLRRALTDTQPPLYYLVLYGWSQLSGLGEAALRSLSALLAVASVVVFGFATRRAFSPGARAWAAAVATTSPLWFVQSQNLRNYSLSLLLFAVMLALALRLRERVRAGSAWPWASWTALTVAGGAAAATHFYGLLGFDALLLALLVTLPSRPLRIALAASAGIVTLGEAAYVHLLVHHTHENFQHLWFRKDPARLAAVSYDVWKLAIGGAVRAAVLGLAVAGGLLALVRHRRAAASAPVLEGEGAWVAGVCAFVLAAVYVGGVAVTLAFAPSLSDRNVLTAAPAAWVLVAAAYDAVVRRLDPRAGAAVALACGVLLVVHALVIGRGRLLERNEPWRETARYVAALPSCRDAAIDVVQPDRFGPDTPFYRMIARRYFFGRYLGDGWPQVSPHPRGDFTDPARDPLLARRLALRSSDPAACPVLAWAVHDVDTDQARALERGISRLPGVAAGSVRLRTFSREHLKGDGWSSQPTGYVIERAPGPGRQGASPPRAGEGVPRAPRPRPPASMRPPG